MLYTLALACELFLSEMTANALTLGLIVRTFGVCAAITITNSGFTVINGPLDLSPGSTYTEFPPDTAISYQIDNALAIACEAQAATTYSTCIGLTPTRILTGVALDDLTLDSGVYKFATTTILNGILTLNASGNFAAQFIFIIDSVFSIAMNSQIVLINSVKTCNVFFCVGSSASIEGNTVSRALLSPTRPLASASALMTLAASSP